MVAEERQSQVDAVLGRFFSLAKKRAAALGAEYEHLWGELEANTVGGKRFRPRMVFAAYEALGGTDSEAAACIGAAFELLHTALIVHDDVIDRDFVRRGGPNLAGAYRDRAGRRRGRRTPDAEACPRCAPSPYRPCRPPDRPRRPAQRALSSGS